MNPTTKLSALALAGALGLSVLGVTRGVSTVASTSSCLGPDKFSDKQIANLKSLMRASDSTRIKFRQRIALSQVADSAITLVGTDSVCAAAITTWHAQGPAFAQFTSLYVIHVGSMYDTVAPSGSEWNQHIVLDSAFRRVAVYLY